MSWNPGLESSLTLRRIFEEDSTRLNKFHKEYTHLMFNAHQSPDMQRVKYLKESMQRFRDRVGLSLYELSARQALKNRFK